jgi:hypothetical protein
VAPPRYTGDLDDDTAWDAYVTEHLSPEQVGILDRAWDRSSRKLLMEHALQIELGAREAQRRITPLGRNWKMDVLAIDVELRPGGRAVLRPRGRGRGTRASYRVEVYWVKSGKQKPRADERQVPRSIQFIGEPEIVVHDVDTDLDAYFAAFLIHISGAPIPAAFKRAPRARPAPGQPPDLEFYRGLIDARDALLAAGDKHPAKELARRYGEEYSTMRAWLSRGQRYLDKEADR